MNAKNTYTNPLAVGADPYILQHDGKYYLYSTNAVNDGYIVYESTDLANWEDKGLCLRKEDVYMPARDGGGFWAPEVYLIDGRFYLFYTVRENIGVAVADSPLGPFKKYSEGFLFPDHKAIDANLFIDDDGKMYLYYVKVEHGNHIYGAEFDLKTLKVGEPVHLISAERNTWEDKDCLVSEGPCTLKHNGVYYLTFSCNHYRCQDYGVGYAVSDSPLGPFKRYENNPILFKKPEEGIFGTGHHTLMTSAGGEMFIVYHRHQSQTEIHPRMVCMDRCEFVKQENGCDVLVVHGPTSTPQPLPL
ncbi:MAG: hypothetical protein E7619_01145 [Ruminococcaceae bacterium]|nr:hypothetical protein [Oscillospiraceae bacterium]